MIGEILWAPTLSILLLSTIASVYLWSKDHPRRQRALQILRLLLGRAQHPSMIEQTPPRRHDGRGRSIRRNPRRSRRLLRGARSPDRRRRTTAWGRSAPPWHFARRTHRHDRTANWSAG